MLRTHFNAIGVLTSYLRTLGTFLYVNQTFNQHKYTTVLVDYVRIAQTKHATFGFHLLKVQHMFCVASTVKKQNFLT